MSSMPAKRLFDITGGRHEPKQTEHSVARFIFTYVDEGCLMIRLGVSGCMFLLVPACPGSPGTTAVKRLRVCYVQKYFSGSLRGKGMGNVEPIAPIAPPSPLWIYHWRGGSAY